MFAVDRVTLLRSLETLRRRICQYGPEAERCDCKFASYAGRDPHEPMNPWPVHHYAIGEGEVSGCAEIEQTIRFFTVMSDAEFDRLYRRQNRKPYAALSRKERLKL